MSFTKVQTVFTEWFLNGTSPSLSVASTGAGNLLVMCLASGDDETNLTFPSGWSTPITVSDNVSSLEVAYYENNPGGITSIQIGNVVNTTYTHVYFFEFSSTGNFAKFDASNTNHGRSGINPVSVTLSNPPELVLGFLEVEGYNDTGTPTYDSGFTGSDFHEASVGSSYAEYNVSSSSGTIDIQPSTSIGTDHWCSLVIAFTSSALHTTPSPSTTLADSAGRPKATSTQPAASTAFSTTRTHGIPTTLSPSSTLTRGYHLALTTNLSPSSALANQAAHRMGVPTTVTVSTVLTAVAAHYQATSTGPALNTGLLADAGRVANPVTSVGPTTQIAATVPRAITSAPNIYTDLSERATHPGFTTQTSPTPSTRIDATRPEAISSQPAAATSFTLLLARLAGLLSTLAPSTGLGKVFGRVRGLASTLAPLHVIRTFKVYTGSTTTTVTPSSALVAFPGRIGGLWTRLSPRTRAASGYGQPADTQTTLSPSHGLTWNYAYAKPLPSTLTPSTTLSESATHIYNPTRTTVSPDTSIATPTLAHTRATLTSLTVATTMAGPAQHLKGISSAPSPSTGLGARPLHLAALTSGPAPSTRMSVEVSRQAVIHTNVEAWTYFVNPAATTYTRVIPQKGMIGGPLLQWLLCRPSVNEKRRPMVATCLP